MRVLCLLVFYGFKLRLQAHVCQFLSHTVSNEIGFADVGVQAHRFFDDFVKMFGNWDVPVSHVFSFWQLHHLSNYYMGENLDRGY